MGSRVQAVGYEGSLFEAVDNISKHGINEEFGIGVIFILADRFANPPVKGVL